MAYYKNHKMKKPNLSDRLGLEDGGETVRQYRLRAIPHHSIKTLYIADRYKTTIPNYSCGYLPNPALKYGPKYGLASYEFSMGCNPAQSPNPLNQQECGQKWGN